MKLWQEMESYAHGKVKYNCGGVNGKIGYKHSSPVTATVSQFYNPHTQKMRYIGAAHCLKKPIYYRYYKVCVWMFVLIYTLGPLPAIVS